MKELGSISFQMQLGEVLELNDVFFILDLEKNSLLVSCTYHFSV